jgi:hypothetical protein
LCRFQRGNYDYFSAFKLVHISDVMFITVYFLTSIPFRPPSDTKLKYLHIFKTLVSSFMITCLHFMINRMFHRLFRKFLLRYIVVSTVSKKEVVIKFSSTASIGSSVSQYLIFFSFGRAVLNSQPVPISNFFSFN